MENAPSSSPEKTGGGIENKIDQIKKSRGIEKEKNLEKPDKGFSEREGDKKIEQILEKGPSKKGENWQERVRPDDKSEFKPLDESEVNEKVINLFKEDSTASLMPDKESTKTLPLNDGEKSKVVSMMTDKKGILPEEITKSPSKIDTYDLVTKNSAAIEAKEDANFLEEVQFDMAAIIPSIDSDFEMEGEGDIEFDFD